MSELSRRVLIASTVASSTVLATAAALAKTSAPLPLAVADKVAIQELMSRFYMAVDSGDADEFAASFTEDGVIVVRGLESSYQEIAGHAALSLFAARFSAPDRKPSRHFVSNFIIEPHEFGARITSMILVAEIAAGPTRLVTAKGDCLARKVGETWRLLRFDHYIDQAPADK